MINLGQKNCLRLVYASATYFSNTFQYGAPSSDPVFPELEFRESTGQERYSAYPSGAAVLRFRCFCLLVKQLLTSVSIKLRDIK